MERLEEFYKVDVEEEIQKCEVSSGIKNLLWDINIK